MTPPRLTELRCPQCKSGHWILDSDYRGMGGVFVAYEERDYPCPACGYSGHSFSVLQQSPPEFLLQPHPIYPMSRRDFDHWMQVLKENFPDHPHGSELRPNTGTWFARLFLWIGWR